MRGRGFGNNRNQGIAHVAEVCSTLRKTIGIRAGRLCSVAAACRAEDGANDSGDRRKTMLFKPDGLP